jgi:hypothetical protein
MQSITIARRYCGPPNSANGGYACGLVANVFGGSGEVTLRAPPPLGRALELVRADDTSVEFRDGQRLLVVGRSARPHVREIPAASFLEAENAARRSSHSDQSRHPFPGCFVRGPARAVGDGLRVFVGPLPARPGREIAVLAASWVPASDSAGADGAVSGECIWAVLDCPSGFACLAARELGMTGGEPVLLAAWPAKSTNVRSPATGVSSSLGRSAETVASSSPAAHSWGRAERFSQSRMQPGWWFTARLWVDAMALLVGIARFWSRRLLQAGNAPALTRMRRSDLAPGHRAST